MIRYVYTSYGVFPAPFVQVTVRCPETGKQEENVPAQLDSGSDRTILPGKFVAGLGLVQMGHLEVVGFAGKVSDCPTYSVEVTIRSLRPLALKVLADHGEPFVLLGRDVLNHFRLLLDGPALALEIG